MVKKLLEKNKNLPVQVRASLWFLVCSVLQKGISIICTPIFIRIMSTAEYGQYGTFNSWLNIITVFVSLRMYYAVYTQGLVKCETEKERNIFSSSLQGLSLTLVAAWTVLYLFTRSFWNDLFDLTTVQMLAMLSLIWSTSVFNYWAAEQRVKLNYQKLVLLTVLVSLAKPIVGVTLVLCSSDKVTARIVAVMAVELIGYCGLFFVQMKRGKVFFSRKNWKYALLFCLPLLPHYLSQTVLNSADKIMIKKMVGDSEAGIYNLAYTLSQIMLMVNQALIQTLSPWIYQKLKKGRAADIQQVAIPAMAIVGCMNLLLIAFAPEIIAVYGPPEYYDAIWIIPPVALSGLFTFGYSLFCTFEFYYEKKSYIVVATALSAGLNLLLNYIFIGRFGYIAAGYTTLVCYMLYTAGHYIIMTAIARKKCGLREVYSTPRLLMLAGGFLAAGAVFLLTYRLPVVRYLFIALLAAAAVVCRKRIMSAVSDILAIRKKKGAKSEKKPEEETPAES